MNRDRQQRRAELVPHVLRFVACVGVVGLGAYVDSDVLRVAGSVALYLACFSWGHDLIHGALGLSKGANDVGLALVDLLMLMSGHARKRSHRIHHQRPLADDDAEGAPARGSLLSAVLSSPRDFWEVKVAGSRGAEGRERNIIAFELAMSVALGIALWLSPWRFAKVHVAVALLLQLSCGVWASWLPHNAPSWLLAMVKPLARGPSIVAKSLAHHDLHHARPDLPSAWLS